MSGPLHELEYYYLYRIYVFTMYFDSRYVVDGREIEGIELRDIVKEVMWDKYHVKMHDTKGPFGSMQNVLPIFMKDSPVAIQRNEEKDTFHYLRDKAEYKAPNFEKLIKMGLCREKEIGVFISVILIVC